MKKMLLFTILSFAILSTGLIAQTHQHDNPPAQQSAQPKQVPAQSKPMIGKMATSNMMQGCPMMQGGMQGGMHGNMASMMMQVPNNVKMLGDFSPPVTKEMAQEAARRYVLYSHSQLLTVGEIKDNPDSYDVQIVTKKGNAVAQVLHIDKKTGYIWKE